MPRRINTVGISKISRAPGVDTMRKQTEAPLVTAEHKRWLRVDYDTNYTGKLGGWNPDANEATIKDDQLSDVLNLRQENLGEYAIRTPAKAYETTANGTLLSTAQYFAGYAGKDFNCAMYAGTSNNVVVTFFDKALETSYNLEIASNATLLANANINQPAITTPDKTTGLPIDGDCFQVGSYLVITIFDVGIFGAYYDIGTSSLKVIQFGRQLSPAPGQGVVTATSTAYSCDAFIGRNFTFNPTPTGDLIVYLANGSDGNGNNSLAEKIIYAPGSVDAASIRLKIGAPYILSAATNVNYDAVRQYVPDVDYQTGFPPNPNLHELDYPYFEPNEGDPARSFELLRSRYHLSNRAWGYRFCVLHRLTAPDGTVLEWRDAPSVDTWVPEMTYLVPHIFPQLYQRGFFSSGAVSFQLGLIHPPIWLNENWLKTNDIDDYNYLAAFYTTAINNDTGAVLTTPQAIKESIAQLLCSSSNNGFQQIPIVSQGGFGVGYPYNVSNAHHLYSPYDNHKSYFLPDANFTDIPLGVPNDRGVYPFSAYQNFEKLQQAFLDGITNQQLPTDGYMYFLSRYLGYSPTSSNPAFDGVCPYKCAVGAAEAFSAPMTVWDWSQFNLDVIADPTIVGVEIYRTAHFESQLKNTLGDPLFQPNLYGLVGTVKPNAPFTDNIADQQIDFGLTPDRYQGYLINQVSGKLLRYYNEKIALANVRSKYWVNTPNGADVQGIGYCDMSAGQLNQAVSMPNGFNPAGMLSYSGGTGAKQADGLPLNAFAIVYVDDQGYASEGSLIPVYADQETTAGGVQALVDVAILLPWGYLATIKTVQIWWGDGTTVQNVGGVQERYWKKVYDGPVTTDVVNINMLSPAKYTTAPVLGTLATAFPLGVNTSDADGAVTWSDPVSYTDWNPSNIILINRETGIVWMETVTGPLWVGTDRSVDMTTLNENDARREMETVYVGCLSKFAVCKIDKMVVFLSAKGLYYAMADGVYQFPADVHNTQVLPYLNEVIPGQPSLLNARRASLGWLNQRRELWLHIPGSKLVRGVPPLGNDTNGHPIVGNMPPTTLIYRFLQENDARNVLNYKLQLLDISDENDNPTDLDFTAFCAHDDGKMYGSFGLILPGFGVTNNITVLDNDYVALDQNGNPAVWTAPTIFEKPNAMDDATEKKILRTVDILADLTANPSLCTGARRTDGGIGDLFHGHLLDQCTVWPVTVLLSGLDYLYSHEPSGNTNDTTARVPYVRLVTVPNNAGQHDVRIKAVNVRFKGEQVHE